jgi:hypothetical protein
MAGIPVTTAELEKAGAALVAKGDFLFWIVDTKNNWDELLAEDGSPPIFTAREVITLWPGHKSEFFTLMRLKKLMPGARMTEFNVFSKENGEILQEL